ncbi:uncharacterized protein LOC141619701 [Silene latifolia]|uniref:uncharacterized protein LOC141619701 n=1 Tax=Silene latifolia TaxID=37657 RepID=UPI003D76C0FA
MFILPSGVIAWIEQICRNFFWDGGADYIRTPLVSWDKLCKPKLEGQIGLKSDINWNKAVVGKLVWWISTKPDHLWVKWVNHIYLKGRTWRDFVPTNDSSWYWRKICQVKQLLEGAYQQHIWSDETGCTYSISKGYEYLRNKNSEVNWAKLVWNTWSITKHSIVSWIYYHNNLNTNEKMHQLGVSNTDTCCICESTTEMLEHLFFMCEYNRKVVWKVGTEVKVDLPISDVRNWRLRRGGMATRSNFTNALINACIYHIWRQRNSGKYESKVLRPEKLAEKIVDEPVSLDNVSLVPDVVSFQVLALNIAWSLSGKAG